MLVLLGFAMVAVFMALIMTKRLTPVLALIIVPTVFGLFAGAGLGIGDMVMDSIKSHGTDRRAADVRHHLLRHHDRRRPVRPAGRRFILRLVGNDPAKVVVGTAVLAGGVAGR